MDTMTISHNFSAKGAGRKLFYIQKEGDGFFTHNLCMPKMLRKLWGIQICMKNMKRKISPPSLPSPGQVPHVSPVTRVLGRGGGGEGGAMSYTDFGKGRGGRHLPQKPAAPKKVFPPVTREL